MEAYIYKYTNKENGKTYIGSRSAYSGSCYDDFNIKYFSSSTDKQFWKDMKDGLLVGEIIFILNSDDANKKIIEIESEYITKFWNEYGKELSYNHYSKGNFSTAGTHRTEQTKKKISDSNKGKIGWNKGVPHTKEHNRKISESLKGKFVGEKSPMYGKPGTMLGKHHSEETKKKMSEKQKLIPRGKLSEQTKQKISIANKGQKRKPLSEQTKQKISISNTGKKHPHSEISKQKISVTSKKVSYKQYKNYITETGEIINMRASLAKRWHPNWKEVV